MTDEIHTWEIQDGESDKAFAGFIEYRNLGSRRRLQEAARLYYGLEEVPDRASSKHRQFSTWSSKFKWVERCRDYDAWADREAVADQIDAVKEMRRRHAAVATVALSKAAERLRMASAESITISDAARLLDLAVKVERLSRGEPDSHAEVTGSAITLVDLHAMARKARDDESD